MTEFMISTGLLALIAIAATVRLQADRNGSDPDLTEKPHDVAHADTSEDYRLTETDMRTIDLIGREAFMDMTRRVDRILSDHETEESITVTLTCGPSDIKSEARLHALLPGDELRLSTHMENGVAVVDVFSDEYRIGSLVLTEADTVMKVMECNRLTGCYVAEQNCYDSPGYVKLDIVVFYSAYSHWHPNVERMRHLINVCRVRLREARPGGFPLEIYTN